MTIRLAKHFLKGKDRVEQQDLVELPTDNLEEIIRHVLEKQHGQELLRVPKTMKLCCCPHPLDLVNVRDLDSRNTEFTCNRCTEPILSWCCKCAQCNYFVHFTCSQLLEELQLPILHRHKLKLAFLPYIWGKLKCDACNLDFNGYMFKCESCLWFFLDVRCTFLPASLMQKAHKHPLLQTNTWPGNKCSSCGIVSSSLYWCEDCDFNLGYECALLLQRVNHRCDKHPLLLSYPPFSDRPSEFYCEICEEEIHPRRWHYHCKECDQSFHPGCFPRLGASRNFCFGRCLEFGRHPHPLKFVREGDYHSSCDSCHAWMYGNRVFNVKLAGSAYAMTVS